MKPDFSGEYVLNRQASTLSPGASAVESGVLRIDHREPTFRCQAAFIAAGKPLEFSFERVSDGREIVAADGEVSSLHWEGDALVSVDRTHAPAPEVTMSWRYELLDGDRLRATERIRGGGRDQDSVWIFDRR